MDYYTYPDKSARGPAVRAAVEKAAGIVRDDHKPPVIGMVKIRMNNGDVLEVRHDIAIARIMQNVATLVE